MFELLLGMLLATTTQTHQARITQPVKRRANPVRRGHEYPKVELYAVNVDERLWWRPVDDQGKTRKNSDKELTRLLRCWHNGQQHKVDSRLGRALYQVARHYPGHRVEIFSGFRPRKYCTRQHSRHLTASAIDFRIDGVKNEALIAWLRQTFHPAGVGYYPNGVHVHLDVDRGHDTYWVDAGDAPAKDDRPIAEVGDTAPADLEAAGDESVDELPRFEPTEPPSVDPALD
jgi:uncharacterized protein YcbK (DUF882 family)